MGAFQKDFEKYRSTILSVQGSPNSKRDLDSNELPHQPKKGKPTDNQIFTDRCVAWYKEQTKDPKEPSAHVMYVFRMELREIHALSPTALQGYFLDSALTNAFVEFFKSEYKALKKESQTSSLPTTTAFEAQYVDANSAVDHFIFYVDECHEAYKKDSTQYHAPYISLCQSSGYGKSRLLQQVSEKRKLLHVCVGESTSSYPGPNFKARELLFLKDSASDDIKRQDHLEQQLKRCVSWCLQENDLTTKKQFEYKPASFWNEIRKHETMIDEQNNEQTIWIAFDEAKTLLQQPFENRLPDFRILHRALKAVSRKMKHCIFAIFVDTNPAIVKFPPSKELDGSYRRILPYSHEGRYLFHPYILLSTHDVLKDSKADFRDEWSFVGCGRPLWKAIYPEPCKSGPDMLSFAADKLRLSTNENTTNELAILAIVICRTGVYLINPQSSMATELAANHMATLLLSDCTHDRFLVTYLSDPVVTVASARLWYQNGLLEKRGITLLRQKLQHGAFLEGNLGNLVARFLLLIGMDATSKNGAYDGEWYKVSEFMRQCFGITDCLDGEKAYMGFSHFIPLVKPPTTNEDLIELLRRRAACCLPPLNVGAELLIPFWKETDTEPLISYMLIQVKNKTSRENGKEMRDNLSPKKCFAEDSPLQEPATDVILIMMEVGITSKTRPPQSERFNEKAQDEKANVEPEDDWKRWVYSVRGISSHSYPFLEGKDDLRKELALLAKGSLDLETWMNDDEARNKRSFPSPPGLEGRKEHILKIVPPIAFNSED
jgi:hypothetical protein